MVEILVVVYLVLGLLATLLFWAALKVSKRPSEQSRSIKSKSLDRYELDHVHPRGQ